MRDGAARIARAFEATHADSAAADALEGLSQKEAVAMTRFAFVTWDGGGNTPPASWHRAGTER